MKTLRRWYWIVTGFVRKYKTGLGLSALAGVLVVFISPVFAQVLPIGGSTYIGRVGSFTLSDLPLDIQQLVSRGLTAIETDGSYQLDVAQSLSVSDDETRYTLTLDPQAYWSSGERLTSFDISLSLPDVEIIREHESSIIFELNEPFAPFPNIIAQPILQRVTSGRLSRRTTIIGLNEYRITNVKLQNQYISSLTLESDEDKIIYRFYPTEDDAITAFKLGHVDKLERMTAPYLEDWPNVQVEKEDQSNRYLSLFFNTRDPDLQNKTIRQLLAYATPKKTDEERVISPINRHSWAYNPQVKPYDHSLDTASEMLDRLKETNANLSLSFELTTTPAYTDMANLIIDSWRRIGIEARLRITPYIDTNNYQILLVGQLVPDDPDQYLLWHSTQATNITNYQSPKIDKLLEDGRRESDLETRRQIYQEFQRFLVEDSPAVFLHELHTYTISRR